MQQTRWRPLDLSDLSVEWTDSVDDLRSIGWDQLAGSGDFYVSTTWLQTLSGPSVGQPWFVIGRARGSGELAAAVACFRLDLNSTPSPLIRLDQFLAKQAAT